MPKLLYLALCLAFAVGCGPRTGIVTGEVSYKGKPIPGGLLTFRPADPAQNSASYELDRDGKFKIELPVGEVQICIDNREFEPQPATAPAIPPGMDLPPRSSRACRLARKRTLKSLTVG